MMPCPWVTHAAHLFNSHPKIDVGIHLTLTSEWDAIKWRPLTAAPSICDENGNFLPLLTPRPDDTRPSLSDVSWSVDEIANEFRAQIDFGVSAFQNVSHISSHMVRHFRDFDHGLGDVISELCEEFGIADDAFGHGLTRIEGYPKHPRDTVSRTSAFIDAVSELSDGDFIFIDHPAVPSAELDETGHTGYEDVAADRITCLETLMSKDLKQSIRELGIELVSYRDL